MAVHLVQHVSFHFNVCRVKSPIWIYISMCLVLWNICYNTSVTAAGTYHVIGSSQAVLAKVGEDVILPCHIEPYDDMARKTVEWSRPDLKPAYVYLLQDGHYIASESVQNPLYKKRTSLFLEELRHGNISMKLTRVQLSDEGEYKCFAPHLDSSSLVQLRVGAESQPVITSNGPKDDGSSLTCFSGCWYPQPEMSWLDLEGNIITAEPSGTDRPSSQHCYVVQRDVTVRQAGTVTCRVHLPHINHTVETHHVIQVQEEGGQSAGATTAIVISVIIILVAAVLGYVYWRKKNTDTLKLPDTVLTRTLITQNHPATQQDGDRMDGLELPGSSEITTPEPRKWISVSERWRPQLEKLANIDDCKVIKVRSLLFVADEEFRIAKGIDGTQVFLGLKDDGTEVAVKRMTKTNYLELKNQKDFLRLLKLEDDSIVRYVDSAEDKDFGYLALQLYEYTLADYITNSERNLTDLIRNQLANQVLQSIRFLHGQNPTIIHRNIKPQNVFIDNEDKARLADLITLLLGHATASGGVTNVWDATETVEKDKVAVSHERSSDIQVAGMLIYYILSGGQHPFGKGVKCGTNILEGNYNLDHVQDVVAKDLIERMINKDPKERPAVEECLDHPYFWSNKRRVEYLRRIGNQKEVENCPDDDKDLITVLDQYAEQGQFNTWKQKFPPELVQKMESYPENSFGLLRFIHNLHEHHADDAAGVDLLEMFPDLFGGVYKFAKEQDWNSRPSLKDMFHTQDVFTSAV